MNSVLGLTIRALALIVTVSSKIHISLKLFLLTTATIKSYGWISRLWYSEAWTAILCLALIKDSSAWVCLNFSSPWKIFAFGFVQTKKNLLDYWRGIGSCKEEKASKLIFLWEQIGQVSVDLYCPAIRSTIIDWFLWRWTSQNVFATCLSSPTKSGISIYYFTLTRFKSSWRVSRSQFRNSIESYWLNPLNIILASPIAFLKCLGLYEEL